MPEPTRIMFDLEEVTRILLENQGLHRGHWAISIQFGLSAHQVQGSYDNVVQTCPTALIPVLKVGVQEIDKPTESSVDASKLKRKSAKKRVKKKVKSAKNAQGTKKPLRKRKPRT